MFRTHLYLHIDPTKGTKVLNLGTGTLEEHCSFRTGWGGGTE